MDLPAAFDLELPHFDLEEALDFLNRAAQQSDDIDDGLRYLFEEAESEVAIPGGECSVHDSAILQADSMDKDLEDCNDYNQSTTPQASLDPAEAAMNCAPLGSEGTSAPGEAHLEMTASALTASLTQDSLYHTQHFDNYLTPHKLSGSFNTLQHVPSQFASPNLEEDAANELALQPVQPLITSNQATQSQASWKPFADVRQGRIWVFGGENGRSAASFADTTIPQTPQQKRAIADKLRAAYESAQPCRHNHEFRLLDWTCLELVEEVCLFHLYGPLTQRYLSGMPKIGPRQYNSYSDHIDDLVAVIGRQNCPKAQNLRKRMIDVTHRKRLVDNPQGELGLVEKNEVANRARKLRQAEKQAKAEALEKENASLKAKLEGRTPAGAGLHQGDAGARFNQSPLDMITPRRSSKFPFVQRSAPTQQALRTPKRGSAFRARSSLASSSEYMSPDVFNTDEDDYGPTPTNINGRPANKKVRYSAHAPMAYSQTPGQSPADSHDSGWATGTQPGFPKPKSYPQSMVGKATPVATRLSTLRPLPSNTAQGPMMSEHDGSVV